MSLGVLDDGSFWFKCPTHDTNLLQPNFAGSWSENADWCEDMLPVEYLKQKTDTDIIKQLKEVFENTRGSIKKGSKGQDMQEVRNHKQRQTARKNHTEMHGPEWDWFFQVGYQSTDESDGGGTQSSKPMVKFASDSEVNEKVVLLNDTVMKSCDPESCGDEDTLYDGGDEEDEEEQGYPPEGTNDTGFEGKVSSPLKI
ncbi:uncharacterized protein EDB91DRAFT_1085408 [Suillus paluster]|uniref:uncharacterized protein n=1 Tax=Suillus paluster TaxID=48578 RepID=UPI001B87F648|nr:uncharacterized protein EDB91DRAFT_1085408 [Suillus paluster]KAG1730534.1 hypothetical protein EDB91DRAFT_1085408 [Suillus paluster]